MNTSQTPHIQNKDNYNETYCSCKYKKFVCNMYNTDRCKTALFLFHKSAKNLLCKNELTAILYVLQITHSFIKASSF